MSDGHCSLSCEVEVVSAIRKFVVLQGKGVSWLNGSEDDRVFVRFSKVNLKTETVLND